MNRDWAALPRELLNLVVERLETPKEFSFVCKSWRSAAKDIQTHCAVTTTPMILISSHTDKDKWHLYNPLDDKVLKTQINLGRHQRICGSSKGWLVAVNGHRTVSLINPFFISEKSTVRLPPFLKLSQFEHENYFVYKATISADPILDADNCIIMVMYDERYSAFLRLNKDSKWTYVLETVDRKCWWFLQDVVRFEDRFYAIDDYGKPYSFDVTTDQSVSNVKVDVRKCGRQEEVYHVKRYLVVCNEKTILMVEMSMDGFDGYRKEKFRVFELNINKGEWTEKNTLGDVALFVGDYSSISVCASESGYRANCVYFINDDVRDERGLEPPLAYDYDVYNVEETRFLENPFNGDAGTLMWKTDVPPIWIIPTYNL